jgi:hypothetical protein
MRPGEPAPRADSDPSCHGAEVVLLWPTDRRLHARLAVIACAIPTAAAFAAPGLAQARQKYPTKPVRVGTREPARLGHVAEATPDGHSLLLISAAGAIGAVLHARLTGGLYVLDLDL